MLRYHVKRLRHQMGAGLRIGGDDFRITGYYPNRMTDDAKAHETHLHAPLSRALAAQSGAFWDVGANLGQTLLKVLSIDRTRSYTGFEPQIECCFFLNDFIQKNRLSNCKILPIALSDRGGFLTLYSSSSTDEMATTVENHLDLEKPMAVHVPARQGDKVVLDLAEDRVGVLKIDVEGAELGVLTGCKTLIEGHRPVIFLEVLPNFVGFSQTPLPQDICRENRLRADAIFTMLSGLGYRIRRIDLTGAEADIDKFELDNAKDFVSFDYVAWPQAAA